MQRGTPDENWVTQDIRKWLTQNNIPFEFTDNHEQLLKKVFEYSHLNASSSISTYTTIAGNTTTSPPKYKDKEQLEIQKLLDNSTESPEIYFKQDSIWIGYRELINNEKEPMKLKVKTRGKGSYLDLKYPGSFRIYTSHTHTSEQVVAENGSIIITPNPLGYHAILTEGISFRKKN